MASDATKLLYWKRHFTDWQSSGLTRRGYCEREGLSLSTFDYWRRQARPNSVTAKQPAAADIPLTLIPARVAAAQTDALVLRSPTGWQLTLPVTVEGTWLAELLKRLP